MYVSTNGWGTGNYGILVQYWLADGQSFLALYGHVRPTNPMLQYSVSGAVSNPIPVRAGEVFATVGPADNISYSDVHLHFGIYPGSDIPPSPWGVMPLAQWPNPNGFVDPVAWITEQTPRDPLGGPTSPAQSPQAPRNLLATAASSSTVALSWQAGSADVQGFTIERKIGVAGLWEALPDVAAGVTSWIDTGLQALTTYYYQIVGYNAAGPSGPSDTASTSTPSGSVAPRITKIDPATPLANGTSQTVTIYGTGFDTNAPVVSLTGPDGNGFCPFVGSHSDTHITFDANFGTAAGNWTVEVINPGGDSVVGYLSVASPETSPTTQPVAPRVVVNLDAFFSLYQIHIRGSQLYAENQPWHAIGVYGNRSKPRPHEPAATVLGGLHAGHGQNRDGHVCTSGGGLGPQLP